MCAGVAPSRAIYFWAYSTAKANLNRTLPPNTDLVNVLSAASAGLLSSCTTNPLWVIKTRMQLEREKASPGVASIVRAIYRERGVRGFWRGVSASAYGISETMMHFVIYEKLKLILLDCELTSRKKTVNDFLALMVCGGVSKTVATTLAYPHEVARTRLREAGTKYSTFWGTLATVHKEEGVVGLYRGLGTNLVRQIPNTAVMMATYEVTTDSSNVLLLYTGYFQLVVYLYLLS